MQIEVVNQRINVVAVATDGQTALVNVVLPPTVTASTVGIQGPAGISARFSFNQPTPAMVWTINHNLGYAVTATVYSVGGVEIEPEIVTVSPNQIQVLFVVATAGSAVII